MRVSEALVVRFLKTSPGFEVHRVTDMGAAFDTFKAVLFLHRSLKTTVTERCASWPPAR